jgi:protein-S-isoprenylcysteine O-methyltransferase Ste14
MPGQGWRYFALVRAAVMATLFMGFTGWWLPRSVGMYGRTWDFSGENAWRLAGWAPLLVGGGLALWCVWEFAWTGRGTPAPWDPPRVLVVKGLYRYVRNPMYVSFATGVFGLWVLIGRANAGAFWYTVGVAAACNAFVRLYEEPVLRSMFGADYNEYCRNVRRWLPRMSAWERGNALSKQNGNEMSAIRSTK